MSDADVQSAWETDHSSGLLTEYVGDVTDAWFATDPNYNQGQTLLLHWETTVIERGQEGFDEVEEITQKIPVGNGWETEDGGKTAVHSSGNANKKVHGSSIYGRFIDAVAGVVEGYGDTATTPDGEPVKVNLGGLLDELRTRGVSPLDAEAFKGLRFRFSEVHFDYGTNRKTGEKMTSQRTMPVEFVTDGGGKKASGAKKAATKKAAAKTEEKAEALAAEDKVAAARARAAAKQAEAAAPAEDAGGSSLVDALLEGTDDAVKEYVTEALAGAESFEEFVDACLANDDIAVNDALMGLVVEDGDGGLWAAAGKGE